MGKGIVVAAAALAVGGCSATHEKAAAEAGVVQFHRMLDAGRYHDIYVGAAAEFRQTGSEQDGIRILQMIHDRLGAFRSSQQSGWRVNYGTGGNIVNLTYNAQFASASGAEDFVFRVNGDAPQLVGYHVNSPVLVGAGTPTNAAPAKPADGSAPQSAVRAAPSAPPKPPEPAGGK